jgi:two-component system, OmpR family, phosphate regulon response regulator PhoB
MPPRRILAIDDEASVLELIRRVLSDESYVVQGASDGRTGLAQVAAFQPDLILCDYRMPDLTGQDVCTLLAADAATRHIPVIIMSAYRAELAPLPPNCLLFLRKPFSLQQLLDSLDDVLGAADRSAG